jgi:ATP-dependent protease ClpP protease subunit
VKNWAQVTVAGRAAFLRVFGEIAPLQTAQQVIADCDDAREFHVTVDSFGGNSPDALKLFDFLRPQDTRVHIAGRAFSSAAIIACAGRVVTMAENATIMLHQPSRYIMGTAAALAEASEHLAPTAGRFEDIIRQRTRQPREVVREWLRQDTYFTAQEALAFRLIDRITPAEVSSPGAVPADELPLPRDASNEQELLFLDFLRAFGRLDVSNRAKFGRELAVWFASNVFESPPPREIGPALAGRGDASTKFMRRTQG